MTSCPTRISQTNEIPVSVSIRGILCVQTVAPREFAMQQSPSPFWFPAKRYGWGWGLPSSWQGWAVLAAFVVLLGASGYAFPPSVRPLEFAASTIVLCVILVAVCFVKGERPTWRWGK